ncbi:hypothetical protein PROPEN_03161 [Proteus penneri ATCC 35198]|nr:hypothetical protein PROPEN_03161 [Proteus penneri ATCC 35198]
MTGLRSKRQSIETSSKGRHAAPKKVKLNRKIVLLFSLLIGHIFIVYRLGCSH